MELEQRLQIVESELSLMKGEVRQILVNLREFLMDERSCWAPKRGDLGGSAGSNSRGRPNQLANSRKKAQFLG